MKYNKNPVKKINNNFFIKSVFSALVIPLLLTACLGKPETPLNEEKTNNIVKLNTPQVESGSSTISNDIREESSPSIDDNQIVVENDLNSSNPAAIKEPVNTASENTNVVQVSAIDVSSIPVPIRQSESTTEPDLLVDSVIISDTPIKEPSNIPEQSSGSIPENVPEESATNSTIQNRATNPLLNDFAHKMFKQHLASRGLFNFVITPANTLTVAGMLLTASAGESTLAIEKSLDWLGLDYTSQLNLNISDNNQINFNSTVWGQMDYVFSEDFLSTLNSRFGVESYFVEYSNPGSNASTDILTWLPPVFSNPKSVVTSEIEKIDNATKIVTGNKLSVTADLLSSFPNIQLVDGLWQDGSDFQETVSMVKIQGNFLSYDTTQFRSVKIPLSSAAITLTIIMPDSQSFEAVEADLENILPEIVTSSVSKEIELMLPVFSIQTKRNLKSIIHDGAYQVSYEKNRASDDLSKNITNTFGFKGSWGLYFPTTSNEFNYSNVSNDKSLIRDIITAQSSITFDNNALNSQSVGIASLMSMSNTTQSDIFTGYSPGYYPGRSGGFLQVSVTDRRPEMITYITRVTDMELCKEVTGSAGAAQSRPFIFVLNDDVTGNILQMGRVTSLLGTKAEKTVCASENVDIADEIWLAEPEYIFADNYTPDISNAVNANVSITADILNKKMIQTFLKASSTDNHLSASMSEIIVSTMLKLAAPDDIVSTWLSTFSENISVAEFRERLSGQLESGELNASLNNSLWAQSDYKISREYLNTISNSFNLTPEVTDFFTDADQQKIDLKNTFTSTAASDFTFEKIVGNRTRLLFASMFSDVIPSQGTSSKSNFLNGNNIIEVDSVKFDGSYRFYENSMLKAFELPSENDLQMLIIMPTPESFDEVKSDLAEHIEIINENLNLQQVIFNVPVFQIENIQHETQVDSSMPYSFVTNSLPVLPMPQFSRNWIKFNAWGINQNGYSFGALIAPADSGGIGNYYFNEIFEYSSVQWQYDSFSDISFMLTPCKPTPTTFDSSAFIFIIRDSNTQLIHQMGQVINVEVNSGVARC